MIKNKWEWKLSYVARIAKYFHLTIDYLVYGNMDEVYRDLVSSYNKLNLELYNFHEEMEKLDTLRSIAIEQMTVHKVKLSASAAAYIKKFRKELKKSRFTRDLVED